MSWSPWQREVLAALGQPPLRHAAPPAVADDPLLHALLRAAARTPESADAAAIARSLPPLSTLRGNAAAKRALWPTLRALRRTRPR